MAAGEGREGERAVEQAEDAVERCGAHRRAAAGGAEQREPAQRQHGRLHAGRGERDGGGEQEEQRVGQPPRGHGQMPRRVSITFTVSDRILRSSHSERL